ncbi:hypothetical protein I4U23_006080 [Adineta vaga]|nr:hypothetical protein I4U23_006080 [Adineta vaga]
MVSYCSSSNDRSLTKCLIQTSSFSFKSSYQFANTSDWTDGLDQWSLSSEHLKKTHSSRQNLYFCQSLGLYLPRREKTKSARTSVTDEFVSSKSASNKLFPKRLRQLFKKEKDLLNDKSPSENEQSPPSHISSSSFSEEENPPVVPTGQQSISNPVKSTNNRSPMHHVQSNNYSRSRQLDNQLYQSSNQDKFKIILKRQLYRLFQNETIDLNCKGTVMRTPSLELKQRNKTTRTISAADSSSIIERYTKLRQVLTSPINDESSINTKFIDHRHSPTIFRGMSTLGLTVTPLAFSSSKHPNCSTETLLPQPVTRSNSHHVNEEQRMSLKRGLISSNDSFSNKTSMDDHSRALRNFHRHHRLAPKTAIQRSKISELLPTVTSEKCFLIPISNHRHS